MATRHVIILGRVQGVGFRDALCNEARHHHLAGWVRNRRDGTVEALLHGAPKDVDTVLRWARVGPRTAQVTQVRILSDAHEPPGHTDFIRLPTA
jgi:acylphosphatase